MKKFKEIIYLLCLLNLTFSQNISITVFDYDTKKVLKDANILLISDNKLELGGSTNNNGEIIFNNVKLDSYQINVSYIGYQNYKEIFVINENKNYNFKYGIKKQSIMMPPLEIISNLNDSYEELPGSAAIMSMKKIRTIAPIGTQELLEHIPGINAFSDDGIGNSRISVGIRGLNPRRSSRVLILEDGIPIQPALYVYPNMYYNPPVERISQVEVIKGSGSISYGPQTMGGVINYLTKRPQGNNNKTIKLTAGENGYGSLFIETGSWIKSDLNPEFQILMKRGDGFRENNSFEQINTTLKFNYIQSDSKTIYSKTNFNYENSNATYTGLTQYSFENNPNFNPKSDDNFKIYRFSSDLIFSEKINKSTLKTNKLFISLFDRRWWRENDIFIYAADIEKENPDPQPYGNYLIGDLIRTGNGLDNFGILRTFYVAGFEQIYKFNHNLFGYKAKTDFGNRVYFERFIDDKQTGDATDSRTGKYYIEAEDEDGFETILGQSHHYETIAFSSFISQSLKVNKLKLRTGLRFEIFEQERVDRLKGAQYQDKTSIVILPGFGFTYDLSLIKFFGGIHRGFTPPSSGALKILNFGDIDNGLDLKSEKSWNKEIGFRANLSLADLECNFFHVDIEDLVAAGRGTSFQNLGKVTNMGIELSSILKLANKISLLPNIHTSYTYLNSKVKDGTVTQAKLFSSNTSKLININGNTLPYAPEHTIVVGIEKTYFNKISIRLDYKYISFVYSDFLNRVDQHPLGIVGVIPGYGIINLSTNYNITSKFNLSLSAKNLADTIYIGSRLHSSPYQPEANLSSGIIPGARRQINIALEYLF